jgi:hypothetical protein
MQAGSASAARASAVVRVIGMRDHVSRRGQNSGNKNHAKNQCNTSQCFRMFICGFSVQIKIPHIDIIQPLYSGKQDGALPHKK